MLVRYKNQKAKMHVMLPIGCKEKAASKGVLVFEAGKCLEIEDAGAMKLVAIDPHNFEIYEPESEEKSEPKGKRKSL